MPRRDPLISRRIKLNGFTFQYKIMKFDRRSSFPWKGRMKYGHIRETFRALTLRQLMQKMRQEAVFRTVPGAKAAHDKMITGDMRRRASYEYRANS
jgi:hypothetical protein